MKLSIAMCTCNGAAYLLDQLQSIATQTRPPDELIICDDASTDATRSIVEDFMSRVRLPIQLRTNDPGLGTRKNFDKAIAACTGDVIALADQDDVWQPQKLARLSTIFAAESDVGLVFSDAELVDAELRPLGGQLWTVMGGASARRDLRRPERALRLLLQGATVTGATMAFREQFRSLVLPIPTDIAMLHDAWIALMISTVARIHFLQEPLVLYRQHAAQQIGARSKPRTALPARAAMLRATSYTDLLQIIALVRRRLGTRGASVPRATLAELEALAVHCETRQQLPARWIYRLPLVAREVLRLRYHRYGRGVKSAAKDLLIGSPVRPNIRSRRVRDHDATPESEGG